MDPAPNWAVPGIEPLGSAALALESSKSKTKSQFNFRGLTGPCLSCKVLGPIALPSQRKVELPPFKVLEQRLKCLIYIEAIEHLEYQEWACFLSHTRELAAFKKLCRDSGLKRSLS